MTFDAKKKPFIAGTKSAPLWSLVKVKEINLRQKKEQHVRYYCPGTDCGELWPICMELQLARAL